MDPISQVNQETYNALAEQYEDKVKTRTDYNRGVISNFVKYVNSGNKVLDIGCAVGMDMAILSEAGFEVTGIEISNEMANYAKIRNPAAKIIVGNFMEENFDEKFDAIFAQAFIHLFPKNEALPVFSRIKNALAENGVAHITTSKSDESKEGWFEKIDYSGSHKRFRKFWTKPELEQIIKQTGFEVLEYYEITDPYGKEWMVFTVRNPI